MFSGFKEAQFCPFRCCRYHWTVWLIPWLTVKGGCQLNTSRALPISTRNDPHKRSISAARPTSEAIRRNTAAGHGNSRSGLDMASAMHCSKAGVERSLSSETRNVCPAAVGCCKQEQIKSTRFSMLTRLRRLCTEANGRGSPLFTRCKRRRKLALPPGP